VLIETRAIICALRSHGEHGVITRVLTPEHGMLAGYVSGGRSRTLRPVLIPANLVQCSLRVRGGEQLPSMSVELIQSRGAIMGEPLAAAGLDWATALAATALPESHPYPQLYAGLDGVLAAIESAPSARGWAVAVMRFELLILASLGYGRKAEDIDDDWSSVFARLESNRGQLAAHFFEGRRADILAARDRLIDRLRRAVA
jgi:DNA repair protein RecO (recombination protein O)